MKEGRTGRRDGLIINSDTYARASLMQRVINVVTNQMPIETQLAQSHQMWDY